jgi:transcriptional regulator with XRE-family HTH domain
MTDDLSKRIKQLREYLGLSQEAFAEKAGLSYHQVSKYERHKISPSSDILLLLRKKYNVNLHWLLSGEGEMLINPAESVLPSGILTADDLASIAFHIRSAYYRYQFKTASAQWVLGLTHVLSILLDLSTKAPRKRKLWRQPAEKVIPIRHYLHENFPGDRGLSVEERINRAKDELSSHVEKKERIKGEYALGVSSCVEVLSREFAHLEYAKKYTVPLDTLADMKSMLEPWCYWLITAAKSTCLPLELDPAIIKDAIDGIQEKGYPKDKRGLVKVEFNLSTGSCSFRFFEEKLCIDCPASGFYELTQAMNAIQQQEIKTEDNARIEMKNWIIDKSHGSVLITKNETIIQLTLKEYGEFAELVDALWLRDGYRNAVVKSVLKNCGAL